MNTQESFPTISHKFNPKGTFLKKFKKNKFNKRRPVQIKNSKTAIREACFSCGKIGHFKNTCPNKTKKENPGKQVNIER
jgi:hypothetical protein